jgi:putative addiction module CopG family antidote
MTSALPPHFAQFVRQQVGVGDFQSEADVICAALRLLEARSRHGGAADESHQHELPAHSSPRRNPRGLLADIYQGIRPEDIDEARREMWSDFPRDDV